jgi:hypothetical protein
VVRFSTNLKKRIDILIESDTFLIGIENKIFHGAVNPFAEYTAYINQRNTNDKANHKFLLTLEPSDAGIEYGFRNLTYPRFIDAIRKHIGYHMMYADTRYLVFLMDFLNTLGNLQAGTHMDLQFISLLDEKVMMLWHCSKQ